MKCGLPWRQKCREGKGKGKNHGLCSNIVCVEIGRQNNILGERREKRTRTRENCPSDLCRLWAPPKSEKVEYWDMGHGFEILELNKNFQFWVFSEIEFWDMIDEWWVMCFESWFLSFEILPIQTPSNLVDLKISYCKLWRIRMIIRLVIVSNTEPTKFSNWTFKLPIDNFVKCEEEMSVGNKWSARVYPKSFFLFLKSFLSFTS